MMVLETVRLAVASLAANKLRSGLTMFGIAVGVFSVIGVMTVISSLRGSIESGLNVLGANSFQIQRYPAINFGDPRHRYANRRAITLEDCERFRDLMDGEAEISFQVVRGNRRVHSREHRTNPNVVVYGTDQFGAGSFNYDIEFGRNITGEDVVFARPVAVIGTDVAKKLFPTEDPLGKSIRVENQMLTIVGQLAEKGSSFGNSQDNIVIIPVTRFLHSFGRQRSLMLNIRAPSADTLMATQERAIGAMRVARGLEPEDPNDFELFSNESLVEAFNSVAGTVAVGAFVISAIALLAAGVGVMNIMLVSVTERTREIGVRKSVGAKRRNILVQFLIEAVALALIGGAFGIATGVIGGNILASVLSGDFVFPWDWAMIGVLVCGGIGVAFGLYPAWRAASLDPIEALRYE